MPSKNPLVKLAARFGVRIARIRPLASPEIEERYTITTTYAPWLQDPMFLDTYTRIREHTLLEKYTAWTLWQSIEQVSKLEGCLIEVGVYRGGSGALIAIRAQQLALNDPVYLCDTFRGIVKSTPEETSFPDGRLSAPRTHVEQLLEQFNLRNVRILEGIFPEETARLITEPKIRFCHIDVDVYHSARDIFEWVWSRMVVGGILIYDDYGSGVTHGIIRHVNETRTRDDLIFVFNLSGQAMFIKIRKSFYALNPGSHPPTASFEKTRPP